MVYHGSILQWIQTKRAPYPIIRVHPFMACLVIHWVTSPLPHVYASSHRNFPKAPIISSNLLCGHTRNTHLALKSNSRFQVSPQIDSSWTYKLTIQKHSKTMLTKWDNILFVMYLQGPQQKKDTVPLKWVISTIDE